MTADPQAWADEFRKSSDNDATIRAMAKHFTCTYMLDMDETKVIVDMRDGVVHDIGVAPAPLDSHQFAIRASAGTWRKFGMAVLPPMCHGIWAASFREDMKLEGDLLVLMQNLRNITVQIELLRRVGVPV